MTEPEPLLADGSAPATAEQLLAALAVLDIEARTVEHEPVFTVQEAKVVRGELPGGHTKNLFLRNKKGRMWLLVCGEDLQLDLKALGAQIGAGRLSFGSADRLMKYLGIIPGAVNPFAVINDHDGVVTVVLESRLMQIEPLNFHPLDNSMTTAISAADLVRFLEAYGHPPQLIDL